VLRKIKIIIHGKPKPQQRHRHTRRGFTYDPSSKDKKDFLALIHSQAPKQPLIGDISIKVVFGMPYVKKHYRTGKYSGELKPNSPKRCIKKPDIDNLLKFIMDAGNKVIWYDDSQIWKVKMKKIYTENPLTLIEIKEKNNDND
tara:strand:- start:33632 stop:34060 length:429 start_codon:yes stop_codon:yes gene_type:complete